MEITKTNGVIYFIDGDKSTMIPEAVLQTAVIEKSGGGINIIYNKGGKDTELNILYANVTTPVVTSSDNLIAELLIFSQAGTTSGSGALYELLSNKSSSIPTDWNSTDKYPNTKAVKDYVDSAISGLLDYRGGYDASGDAYPSTGGSGTAGAISKGDTFVISVAGTLGTIDVIVGDIIIAKVDAATDDDADWDVLNIGVSYVPEDSANKVTSVNVNSTDDQYPSAKAMYAALQGKVNNANHALSISGQDLTIVGGNTVTIPSGGSLDYYEVYADGTNAATAPELIIGFNHVSYSPSAVSGVALPLATEGNEIYLVNTSLQPIYVYGDTSNNPVIKYSIVNFSSNSSRITVKSNEAVRFIKVNGGWFAENFKGKSDTPRVYKAILTQSGTNAPVATVLNGNDANYLSGVTFSRDSAGTYYILRTGFSATNTLVHFDRATNKLSTHSITSGTNYILYEQYELSGGTATKYEGITMGFITIEYYG